VRSLVESGLLDITTGVEVGKMAYGMGRVPFIRTSDLIAWEVNRVTKQGISDAVYEAYPEAALRPYDILLVRDGTYLVGSSAMVMPDDLPALCSGGLYRLRSRDTERLDPHVLLAALNEPLARRQMRAKQFTRDVIDTLGTRILEVRIPPVCDGNGQPVGAKVRRIMGQKAAIKREITAIIDALEPPSPPFAVGRPGWSMR